MTEQMETPHSCFQLTGNDTITDIDILNHENSEKDTAGDKTPVYCRQCGQRITDTGKRITVNDAHCHNFANPEGLVFEIGCFSEAEGCTYTGIPTNEFTWFRGLNWQIALCRKCLTHLGWMFASSSGGHFLPGSFNGLILKKLIFTREENE